PNNGVDELGRIFLSFPRLKRLYLGANGLTSLPQDDIRAFIAKQNPEKEENASNNSNKTNDEPPRLDTLALNENYLNLARLYDIIQLLEDHQCSVAYGHQLK